MTPPMTPSTTFRLVRDTILDPGALTFPWGRWGIGVNGQTYQQEALVSFGEYQYATHFSAGGKLCVGRRRLPDASWEVITFSDYTMGDHCDAHNVAVIGICPRDGSIHLSFDHHNDSLRYRRSVPGLASGPAEIPWIPESFGAISGELVPGKAFEKFTYPQFFATPEGNLQLLYRLDWSGNGDWYMAEYDGETGHWTILGMLLDRVGVQGESTSRCAYPNPIRYDAVGRLHITWCWRENLGLGGNHDLCYAYSDDYGRTWFGNDGSLVAVLSPDPARARVISLETLGIIFQEIPENWGLMNVTTEFIDGAGRVHVVAWQNPLGATGPNMDLNAWGYVHYWREPGGSWHNHLLPFVGRKPQLAVGKDGAAYLVFCKGPQLNYENAIAEGRLMVARATEESAWSDWEIVWQSEGDFISEPLFDGDRWRQEEVLSVYAQELPGQPGQPSPLHVFDFAP